MPPNGPASLMRASHRSHLLGVGMTKLGKSSLSASMLMKEACETALAHAGVRLKQLDGMIAVPALAEPRFMQAHYLATMMGLLPHTGVVCRTLDTGGASPVSALLEADRLIRAHGCDLIAIVAGDAVASMPSAEFLKAADAGCNDPIHPLPSPVIPSGYNRIAAWQMNATGVTREQLAMVAVLMSRQACKHPLALTKTPYTLDQVLSSKPIASHTNLLECARRADGAAAVIVASSRFLRDNGLENRIAPVIIAGGEASGPLYPPAIIDSSMFSCEHAAKVAYQSAQLGPADIDAFFLYDCFPICFIRAVEAVGLAAPGRGGQWVEQRYRESEANGGRTSPDTFPVNTHGGLLSFGAPWETPALFSVIEAYAQLTGTAGAERQVKNCRRALVYGNGGIFSASSLAILGRGYY